MTRLEVKAAEAAPTAWVGEKVEAVGEEALRAVEVAGVETVAVWARVVASVGPSTSWRAAVEGCGAAVEGCGGAARATRGAKRAG